MSLFGQKPSQPSTGFSFGSGAALQPAQPPTATQPATANTATTATLQSNTGSTFSSGTQATALTGIAPDASSGKVLKDLLDLAHNLPRLNYGNLGSIHLTLNELQKQTLQLRKSEQELGNYTKAHYLLSSSGINGTDFENDLKHLAKVAKDDRTERTLDRSNQQEGLSAILQPDDIEKFLVAKKDENIIYAIEQSLASASDDFDRFIDQNVSVDWKVRREHLKKSLGIPVKAKITSEELAKSFIWNNSLPGNYRLLSPLATKSASASKLLSRDKFEAHAKIVYHLNEARLQSKAYPLCLSFEELNKTNADLKSKQMSEVWRVLANLCNEKFTKINQELVFYDDYHKPSIALKLKKLIVQTSRSYLETQFYNYMDEIYTKDDKKPPELLPANNFNKVSYFIKKVIAKNNDSSIMDRTLNFNGTPIWAVLLYMLRSGLYSDAIELTNTNKDAFVKFDENFPVYLRHFVNLDCVGLSNDLQERISSDFNQTFLFLNEDSPNFDPYKYAVYKIIGKCDLAKKSLPNALNLSIEDWLWYHLLLINEFNPDGASSLLFENYNLENLQRKVILLGPNRFNASSNNPMYGKTLVLLGLYELAVQYVYENNSECDAVHLAIGLGYYGLLKVTNSNADNLITANSEGYEVNYGRLLGSYTRSFKISDPKVAAEYLILICLGKNGEHSQETANCHEALRELILITREFGLLLGELDQTNGQVTPGILEKQRALIGLENIQKFYQQIVAVSAKRCEEDGRVFDALRLYQLCQEYNTVVSLINKYLSELLSMTELDKPLLSKGEYRTPTGELKPEETIDNNLILYSQHTMSVFNNNGLILGKISKEEKEINGYLLPIIGIREKFVNKDWHGTLAAIKNLALVPIVEDDDYVAIRQAAQSLSGYDVCLVKVIPSLLIIVMTCVSQINYTILTKRFGAGDRERDEVNRLKAISKNCMVYAGMIQYRMPRETYSLLVNLEAQL